MRNLTNMYAAIVIVLTAGIIWIVAAQDTDHRCTAPCTVSGFQYEDEMAVDYRGGKVYVRRIQP